MRGVRTLPGKASSWSLLLVVSFASAPPFSSQINSQSRPFKIRTITAGVNLKSAGDLAAVEKAIGFLQKAKRRFEGAGYEVQTLRIATQPLPRYLGSRTLDETLEDLKGIDRAVTGEGVLLSIGPVVTDDRNESRLGSWAAKLIRETRNINFSVTVASPERGVHVQTVLAAAAAIMTVAHGTPGGEGNFRLTAAANCPAGIPFFPAAFHEGEEDFAIGLESAALVRNAFESAKSIGEGKMRLKAALESELAPVEKLAMEMAGDAHTRYLGIDVSPAPSKDRSIGAAIEALTHAPFGSASTLSVCAAITDVLQTLNVRRCGFSGLMLPVLEDPVLAQRAAEGRYNVQELLLYSAVSGTGLDVVPLPGDTPVAELAALIGDVAALSTKLHKPLSARLFPIPGKKAGQRVVFHNPFLTDSIVMKVN